MIRSAETPLNTADASSGEKQNAPSCIKFQSVIRTLHGKHRTIIIIIWYPITCLFVFKLKTNCTITHNLYHGQILDWQLCIKQHLDTRQAQLARRFSGAGGRSPELHPSASLTGRAGLGAVQGPVCPRRYFVRSLLFFCRKVILGGGAGNALWKQEAQVIHVLRNAGQGGRGSAPSVFKGTLWIDLLSKKITKRVGKLLRKLSSETFPSYSLLICLPCFIGLLLLS